MKRMTRVGWLGLGLLTMTLAGGCSDDSSDTSTDDGGSSGTTAEASTGEGS